MFASSYTTLFNFSSVGLLPSSVISESVTLLNGGKFNPVGALSRAARYLHTTRQIESTSVATLPVKTKVPSVPPSSELGLHYLSQADWRCVSEAVGVRLHPFLQGRQLHVSAQAILKNFSSSKRFPALNLTTRRSLSRLARLVDQPSPKLWQISKKSLQTFSEQRLLALEARANEESDNPYVQAAYLEAALEVDANYVIRRVESGQYAVNDDVRYIYKKAMEKLEASEAPSTIHVQARDNEILISGASKDKEIRIPLEIKVKEKTGFLKEIWYLARFILLAFFIAVLISSIFSAQIRGGTQHMVKEFLPDSNDQKYKFDDVQGIEEAKQEVREVVEFLKNPKRFQTLGAKLPKGVLLVGPPGTGKTLLARAIAGEAEVPFFFASGSEFDEMFVGVGAARMRKLFEQARRHKPCVVFIDELDAVGGARVATAVHPYSRMTLNQLLVELDGYKELEGVIIIGATNFPESLDKALVRPGRFDSTVTITLPDVKARHDILKVHAAKVKLSPEVDLEIIARGTAGFSGADLANMVNQAALRGSADSHDSVTMEDLEYAKDKIIMGPERKSAVIEQKNKEIVAYHEGGHALVALYTPGALPIHKATIIPRGSALGMVVQLPEKDELSWSKKQLLARLDVSMGGRVAEEMVFGKENVTSGASSDLQAATRIARAMVMKYAMSDVVGPIAVGDEDKLSPETRQLIENEIKKLLIDSYERARDILKTRSKEHRRLAEALLKYETLNFDEIKLVVEGKSLKRTL